MDKDSDSEEVDDSKVRYENGKILSCGMIGIVILARDIINEMHPLRCIKVMDGEKLAEKRLFNSLRTELKILEKVSPLPGCIELLDIVNYNEEKLTGIGLVFPFMYHGDLYSYKRRVY